MKEVEMLTLVHDLMAAKKDHNIEALLALYHRDCVLEQPSLNVKSQGHAAIKPGLELFALHFPDYHRSFDGHAVNGRELVSWGMASMTLTGEFGNSKPNGKKSQVMTFVLFEFCENKIIREGHYWDLASICRQSGISADVLQQG